MWFVELSFSQMHGSTGIFLFSLYLVFMMEKRLSTGAVTPQLNKDIWQIDCNTKIPLEAAAGVERQSHWEPVGGIQLLVQT